MCLTGTEFKMVADISGADFGISKTELINSKGLTPRLNKISIKKLIL